MHDITNNFEEEAIFAADLKRFEKNMYFKITDHQAFAIAGGGCGCRAWCYFLLRAGLRLSAGILLGWRGGQSRSL
jgi:hypothetical protein